MQPKVLVIGSSEHSRAHCVDWLQPFPNIEEYDFVILNLQSLHQNVYDRITMKIRKMRESIKTVLHTEREIFCIMNKLIAPSPPPRSPDAPVFKGIVVGHVSPTTNYDWLPISIRISNRKKGTSINVSNDRFNEYFECVDRWNLEIDTSVETTAEMVQNFIYGFEPIATNISKKTIAVSLKRGGLLNGVFQIEYDGAIHLLPPPTKCDIHLAIEKLLDMVCGGEEKKVPPWRKEIEVPKIRELQNKIAEKTKNIKEIQEDISQLRNQIQEWDSYRDLLTETGDELERIVQKALSDIGIKTRKTEEGFPADLISNKVAIEVTGIKGSVRVSSEKVNQTGRFKESYDKGQKMILVANTYLVLSPKDRRRKKDFSPQVEKYFESLSVCCFTTKTLFQLWKDVVTGERTSKDVKRAIFSKNGELILSDFR